MQIDESVIRLVFIFILIVLYTWIPCSISARELSRCIVLVDLAGPFRVPKFAVAVVDIRSFDRALVSPGSVAPVLVLHVVLVE